MKRYKEYQTISLPWLNNIPANWTMHRNKVFLHESKDVVGNKSKDYTLLSLTLNGIIPRDVSSGKGKFPSDFGTYKIIRPNDIVFCLFDIDETPRTVGLSNLNGMLTGAYDVFHVSGINSRYLLYYYIYLDNVKALRPLYKGLRKTINIDTFLGTRMPVPPSAEQDQIVRYLDWQVSKINRLIAAKKKQIGLLKEQERSVVVYYITHGCNPHAIMKDSGIDWAEKISQHWDVLFLQQIAEERFVKNAGMLEDNLLSLSYGHIIRKDINTTDGLLPASFEGYQIVEKDDTVLRLTDLQNDHRSLRTGLVLERGIITSAYTCIKPRKNILPEYLQLQLHSADLCKVFYGLGGGVRQSIGYKDIRKLLMFVPPIEEQQEILDAIKRESASSLPCYNKLEAEITVLQELRTRLISDVVTGQIDVRDIEIPDFEYTSETDDNGEDTDDEESDDMAEEGV